MALFLKITKECEDAANRYNQLSALNKIKNNIETYQNLSGFEFLPHTGFIKKPLSNNYRIIGYRITKDNDELLLLLNILPRNSRDYRFFLENWEENTEKCISRFVKYNDEEVDSLFKELKQLPPPQTLPSLNEEERKWLYEVFLEKKRFNDDLIVFETEEWVKWMSNPDNREHLLFYHQLLEGLDFNKLHKASTNIEFREYWDEKRNYGIVYLYRPEINTILLLKPISSAHKDFELLSNNNEDYIKKLSEYSDDNDSLVRIAVRSYPFLMVLDKESWVKIQKDEEANLALSPEEAKLLESIRNLGDSKTDSYPLFINGRAGSGKSTMLQYLAADYIDFAIRNNMKHRILYMTCSPDLLERARNIVKKLLSFHHERFLRDKISENVIENNLKNSFVVFSEFLYSILDKEIQAKLPKEKYVDYSKFKFLWKEQFAKRPSAKEISPDVAWHTIRSYIKGMRLSHDDEISPEEYMAIPRKRRSITQEMFENIYEKVWCGWYKRLCEQEMYWDDQDLAAYVFEEGAADKIECAAIFCDEAQDFTPIELNIIYQMSLFGKRSLNPEELKRVPIIFAGDPLQTINPTGFSWEAVKAEFHDRFYAILDPRRKAQIDITFKDLSFNYRSNSGIVKFCNLIQLMRSAMLQSYDITPQDPWWIDKQAQILWFDNEEIIKDGLKKRPDLVVLVNCEVGEEANFVSNDSILKNLKEHIEDVYQNVFSPMRAKGLEFQGVVLYRFIETNFNILKKLLDGKVNLNSPENKLTYEYFFNRLYVAASRAKKQLVIFDSPYAIENFWKVTYERAEELAKNTKDENLWKNKIMTASQGKKEWWEGKTVDTKTQAEQYEKEGRKKSDPYLLKQAALLYRNLGEDFKADSCIAHAYYLECNFNKAGDLYFKNDLYKDAFDCYWRAKEWKKIKDVCNRVSEFSSKLESAAADYMLQTKSLDKKFIERIIISFDEKYNKDWTNEIINDVTWNEIFQNLVDRIAKEKEDINLKWDVFFKIFETLLEQGLKLKDESLGMIAFRAKKYDVAVKLWEKSKYIEHKEYYYAKAYTTKFPQNVIYYERVKDYEAILKEYNKNSIKLNELDEKTLKIIAEAAIKQEELSLALEALNLLVKVRDSKEKFIKEIELTKELLIKATNKENSNILNKAAEIAMRIFLYKKEWKNVFDVIDYLNFSILKDESEKLKDKIKKLLKKEQIKHIFIEEIENIEPNTIKDDIEKIITEENDLFLAAKLLKYRPDKGNILKLLIEGSNRENTTLILESLNLLIEFLMNIKNWENLIKIAENKDFSSILNEDTMYLNEKINNLKINNLISQEQILGIIIEKLARSTLIVGETKKNKTIVAGFLKRNFIEKETSLPLSNFPQKFIGAAIERAGMFEDMLKYYHNLKSSADIKIKKFATERLIVTYEKYAEFAKKKDQENTAKKREERAKILRKHEGLENKNLPEFPYFDDEDLIYTKKEEILSKHEDIIKSNFLKITHSEEHKRLRIENKEKFETVTVIYGCSRDNYLTLKGDADFSEAPVKTGELRAWIINEWNIRLSVIEKNGNQFIVIHYSDGKKEDFLLT